MADFTGWVIVDRDGKKYKITRKNWKRCKLWRRKEKIYELLKIFVRNELAGKKPGKRPKHIEYMRKLELIDYCPESDVGNMKWYPNGIFIKDLILDYALQNIALPWGAMKMQNPLIYRRDVEQIRELQGEFVERDYHWEDEGKPLVLRFASDPGAFPFIQKTLFSYYHMPLKVYEEAICFRKEQRGELVGLMRVRNFWMTDMHAFCKSEGEARREYEKLSYLFAKLMNQVISPGRWVLGFEIAQEFFKRYQDWLVKLIKKIGVPAFIKIEQKMTHYYAFKNEYQAIFPSEDNLQISTVQWDVKNGERFGIRYVGKDGRKHVVPFIIHASSFGSIERAICAILEQAAWLEKEGLCPMLPVWLSPEQVRLVPVADRHLRFAKQVAKKLEENQIRVGIDDRSLTVSKKVFEAKQKWIPYVVCLGDKELKSKKIPVLIRRKAKLYEEKIRRMTIDQLVKRIKRECKQMPFRKAYMPALLSQRPTFVAWSER
jgi:threonyl-tRNA synthetase